MNRRPKPSLRVEESLLPLNFRAVTREQQPITTAAPEAAPPGDVAAVDPERWVDEHGDFLYSYTVFRLRDPVASQDVVQETFLAALNNSRAFAGRSVERGWLLGILKHKIHDFFRTESRELPFADPEFFQDGEDAHFSVRGLHKGAWSHELGPKSWPGDPGEGLDREEFWKVFRACASKLPVKISRAFLMRELDGADTGSICAALNVSESNLWVMLHRARMALRRCLELNWFCHSKEAVRRVAHKKE